jgi:hypothetical protein
VRRLRKHDSDSRRSSTSAFYGHGGSVAARGSSELERRDRSARFQFLASHRPLDHLVRLGRAQLGAARLRRVV